jgi:hypothetical protein
VLALMVVLYLWVVLYVSKVLQYCGRETPAVDMDAYYRRAVTVAGGVYVGIQECDDPSLNCVLFNHPHTGSTLAVKESDFTAVAVENKLNAHEAQWGII